MAFRAAEYERYQGPRTRRPAWWPLMSATLFRGWSSRWVRRITWISLVQGFGLCVLMYVLNDVIPSWREISANLGRQTGMEEAFTIDARLYLRLLSLFVYPVLMPLALLFGYDLISRDFETNATEAYFARPITPASYLLGRTLAFIGFLLAATLGPMLLVWIADYATSGEEHFDAISHVPLGMTAALTLISASLALLVQAVSILTRSGTWTNLVLVVVFLFGQAMAWILYEMTDNLRMLAISIPHNTFVICASLLGELGRYDEHAPAGLSFAVMGGVAVVSALILLRGLNKRSMLG